MSLRIRRRSVLRHAASLAAVGLAACAQPLTEAQRARVRRIVVLGAVGERIRYAHGGSRAGLAPFIDARPLGFPRVAADTVAAAIRPALPGAEVVTAADVSETLVDAFRLYGVGNERTAPYLRERFAAADADLLFVVHDTRAFRARSGSTPAGEYGVGLVTYGPIDDTTIATYANVAVARLDARSFAVEAEQGAVWGHPTLRQSELVRLGHPLRGSLGATLTAAQLEQAGPMFRHLLAWSVADATRRHGFPAPMPRPPEGIPTPIGLV